MPGWCPHLLQALSAARKVETSSVRIDCVRRDRRAPSTGSPVRREAELRGDAHRPRGHSLKTISEKAARTGGRPPGPRKDSDWCPGDRSGPRRSQTWKRPQSFPAFSRCHSSAEIPLAAAAAMVPTQPALRDSRKPEDGAAYDPRDRRRSPGSGDPDLDPVAARRPCRVLHGVRRALADDGTVAQQRATRPLGSRRGRGTSRRGRCPAGRRRRQRWPDRRSP